VKQKNQPEEILGKPQFGGTLNLKIDSDIMTFDPNARSFNYSIMSAGWKACILVTGHLNRCRLTTNTANPTIPIAI